MAEDNLITAFSETLGLSSGYKQSGVQRDAIIAGNFIAARNCAENLATPSKVGAALSCQTFTLPDEVAQATAHYGYFKIVGPRDVELLAKRLLQHLVNMAISVTVKSTFTVDNSRLRPAPILSGTLCVRIENGDFTLSSPADVRGKARVLIHDLSGRADVADVCFFQCLDLLYICHEPAQWEEIKQILIANGIYAKEFFKKIDDLQSPPEEVDLIKLNKTFGRGVIKQQDGTTKLLHSLVLSSIERATKVLQRISRLQSCLSAESC